MRRLSSPALRASLAVIATVTMAGFNAGSAVAETGTAAPAKPATTLKSIVQRQLLDSLCVYARGTRDGRKNLSATVMKDRHGTFQAAPYNGEALMWLVKGKETLNKTAKSQGRTVDYEVRYGPIGKLFESVVGVSAGKKRKRHPLKTSKAAIDLAIAWMPVPTTPMCGSTAQAFYDAAAKWSARNLGDTLVWSLKYPKPPAKSVKKAYPKWIKAQRRVAKMQRARKEPGKPALDPYLTSCSALEAPSAHQNTTRLSNCLWWLRRAVAGDRPNVARVVLHILKTYDAQWWTANEKRLPKDWR